MHNTLTRNSDTETVAAWCKERHLPAELVGRWIWLTFEQKPDADTRQSLKDAGFHWNQKRQCWQHACGVRRRFDKTGNPKQRYGAIALESDPA